MAKITKEEVKPKNYEEELEALRKELQADNKPEDIYISSGSFVLDIHLGGRGWKCGKIAELIAWEGCGKTTVCLHTIAECQKANVEYAYIDAEHAINPEYAKKIGVNWEHFKKRLFQPMNGEEAFEIAKRLIKTGVCRVIIFDSTSGMRPQKEMDDPAGTSNLGLHARLFSAEVPKINALASKYNTLCIFISQMREKIGVMFGSPETTQAGNALKFFDDYRIDIRKTVESANGKDEDATGITSRFHIVKNKVYEPYHKGEFHIIKMQGIDKTREIIDIASELDILYKYGQTIKINKDTEKEEKYDLTNFMGMLNNNPEYVDYLKHEILLKLKLLCEELS